MNYLMDRCRDSVTPKISRAIGFLIKKYHIKKRKRKGKKVSLIYRRDIVDRQLRGEVFDVC